ncbi:EamA family transporter [Sphingobium sp. H39-3-25]|uniref:DMT family transporter n=1 Tax=Sphingobium arseniciresistens TaxID=3030834 RepID=UPI0023B900B7|nr:EamA family transporter [Sphingobium arseniciresistens]
MIFPVWLPATLLAGALQAWRTALQKRARNSLSVNTAGLVRYFYGIPFALALVMLYRLFIAAPSLEIGQRFLPLCVAAGFAQILATNLLLMAFSHRNFVVGIAYSKTEAVQGALLSFLLLGERMTPLAWVGIGFGVAGVMLLSTGGKRMGPLDFVKALGQPAAIYGIASGFLFALTAIGVRRATQEVGGGDPIHAALIVLATVVILQTMLQGSYVLLREPGQIRVLLESWRISGQVGMLSALGSACWFTGFATAPVALVRIVGQVEIMFTMALGHYYLKERMVRSEFIGLLLIATGVILALAGSLS